MSQIEVLWPPNQAKCFEKLVYTCHQSHRFIVPFKNGFDVAVYKDLRCPNGNGQNSLQIKSILSLGLFHFNRYSTEHIIIFFFVFFIHNNKFTGILTAFLLSFFLILFLSLCLCFQNFDYDLLFFNKESPDDPGNTKKILVSNEHWKKRLVLICWFLHNQNQDVTVHLHVPSKSSLFFLYRLKMGSKWPKHF